MNRLEDAYGKDAFAESQFRGHPAVLLMFSDGEEIWHFQGVATYEQMEEEILAQID